MAVATGVADVVVCYRGFNERSGQRFGQVQNWAAAQVNSNGLDNAWTYPHGLSTPAATVAMQARRYMHEYGATSADFGTVAVADRRHAANNPDAFFYGKPITIEDHQSSRMIADPLRLLDCCQESDGAVAIVVTTPERAAVAEAAGRVDHGRGAGECAGPVRDDVVLPRRHRRTRDGRRRSRAVAPVRARPGRHRDGGALRPLHAVRPDAARGARLLRPRRGPRLHRRRRHRDRRPAAAEHPRRPARRGLHPRHERHRRGRPPGPRHLGQPGPRRPTTSSSPPAPAYPPPA